MDLRSDHERRPAISRAFRGKRAVRLVAMMILTLSGCAPDALEWSSWVTLTPEGARLSALVEAADARWEAAGVHPGAIVVAPLGGIGVGWLPAGDTMAKACRLHDARNVCGCVVLQKESGPTHVWLHPRCSNDNVLAHELGHLLAGRPGHLGAADGCSKRNDLDVRAPHLMCELAGDRITEADLELVCAAAPCVAFSPEAER